MQKTKKVQSQKTNFSGVGKHLISTSQFEFGACLEKSQHGSKSGLLCNKAIILARGLIFFSFFRALIKVKVNCYKSILALLQGFGTSIFWIYTFGVTQICLQLPTYLLRRPQLLRKSALVICIQPCVTKIKVVYLIHV